MNRSHVIRLNTTPEHDIYFRKACGVARHAYNWALARWKEARAEGKRVTTRDLKAEYNKIKGEQFPWCYEVTKCAPEQAFADLGQALANDKFSVHGQTLRVPKLGDVNMTEELRFQGKIMSATISYQAGWWFVSIAAEVEHETPTHKGGTVGIDLGIKTLATTSSGEKFESPKRRHPKEMSGLHRRRETYPPSGNAEG